MNDPRPTSARVHALPKQPPHSIEAEQSVLGGLMLNNSVLDEIGDKLCAEDFYRTDHQTIYRGICELVGAAKPCDFVTLSEHLAGSGRIDEAGGRGYLGTLAAETYSIANVVSYAAIVRERATLRSLIAAGADIGDLGYRPDGREVVDLVDEAEQKVFAIRERGAKARAAYESIGAVMERVERRIEAMRNDPKSLAGLSTGFTELDRRTHGLHPGDLVIIAARPGMGKTTLAMNIAEHVSLVDNLPAAVFSMEMSAEQLGMRVLASFGRVELGKLRSGHLGDADYDKMVAADALVRRAPLYIDQTGSLSPMDIRARVRRLHARHALKLVVVDYIQLMQVPGTRENRTNEVAQITRQLKALAKELGVPILALSQLSRANVKESRRPKLSDLRDSGGIEQDADLVLFIHRDDPVDEDNTIDKTKAEIIIGKQRSGPTGHFPLTFLGQFTKFDNPADQSYAATGGGSSGFD